ncbi:6-bladed beta-propeller [Parabacteroides goldsteinii]|uniref:6-bladed beta-propeller n=1 Tax=Parabacteroides goldsteinii TaxID=328812 RepID=UPI0025ADC89F|nr:6-bladed beta-propeller [Parabacteroides goldsteinii]
MKESVIILLVVLIGCTTKTSSPQEEVKVDSLNKNVSYPVKISLQEAMKNVDNTITLSSFVDSIEYIPLKLPNKYAISRFQMYDYDEDIGLFFIGDYNRVLVINKKGEFLRTIGRIGGGPGELANISNVSIDKKNKYVYLYSAQMGAMFRFDYEGKFLKKMFSILTDTDKYRAAYMFYNNDDFVSISETYTYKMEPLKDRLYGYGVLDTLGRMLDHTPSQHTQLDTKKDKYAGLMFNYQMTRFKGSNLLVPSGLADTIFTEIDNKVKPRYLLDYGDDKPDLSKLWSYGEEREYVMYHSIFIMNPAYETLRYFIIKLRKKGVEYIVIHDKYLNNSCSVIYDYVADENRDPNIPINNLGFYNDLDGGVDAYPMIMSSEGNYWVSYVESYQMKELLSKEHFEKRKNVHNLEQQEELKKMLPEMKEDGDQVLILMKLKKSVL